MSKRLVVFLPCLISPQFYRCVAAAPSARPNIKPAHGNHSRLDNTRQPSGFFVVWNMRFAGMIIGKRVSKGDSMAEQAVETDSGWVFVGLKMPVNAQVVWGFDAYYHKEGPCVFNGRHLEFTSGDDDCFIVLWRPLLFRVPTSEEIGKAMILASQEKD